MKAISNVQRTGLAHSTKSHKGEYKDNQIGAQKMTEMSKFKNKGPCKYNIKGKNVINCSPKVKFKPNQPDIRVYLSPKGRSSTNQKHQKYAIQTHEEGIQEVRPKANPNRE